jgi:hypothetical protein
MKRIIVVLAWTLFFTGNPFSPWNTAKNIWASNTPQYYLRVASCTTENEARRKTERLKSANLQAQYVRWKDRSKKTGFVVEIGGYQTEKEAIRNGNQLIRKGIIKKFLVFSKKEKEGVSTKVKEVSPPLSSLPDKGPKPILEEKPVYFGPISVKEEENSLRINISMDRPIFPTVTTEKLADGSHLIVTFKNIGHYIVPFEFDKVQSKTLLSLSLTQRGTDCIFILLLNPANNYEVARDYYEQDKKYSLLIRKEPTPEPKQEIKE